MPLKTSKPCRLIHVRSNCTKQHAVWYSLGARDSARSIKYSARTSSIFRVVFVGGDKLTMYMVPLGYLETSRPSCTSFDYQCYVNEASVKGTSSARIGYSDST